MLGATACAEPGARPQAPAPHASRGFAPDPSVPGISCGEVPHPNLELACRHDAVCGCALYGRALLEDDARAADALRILEEACHRGALDACDDGLLAASICGLERDQHRPRRRLCDLLDAEGLLPPPEPPEPPEEVPAPLEAVDAAALGEVEDLCARARACVAAVARMLPPAEPSDAPYVDPFTSALACEDARREAVKAVKQPPPACR